VRSFLLCCHFFYRLTGGHDPGHLFVISRLDDEAAPEAGGMTLPVLDASYVAPKGRVEETLAAIWAEVLGVERIGAATDFFAAGGDARSAAEAAQRTQQRLGVEVPAADLLEGPTVRELARTVAGRLVRASLPAAARAAPARASAGGTTPVRSAAAAPDDAIVPVLRPAPGGEGLPLSFAQERLWFLEQMDPGRPVYNMSGAARVTGRLAPALLADTVAALVRRHEALRTVFPVRDARPVQEVLPAARVPLPVIDLSDVEGPARAAAADALAVAEARRPFDLTAGPLLRTVLLRLSAAEHVLLVTMHHVVSDGWSVAIFLREMTALYGAAAAGAKGAKGAEARLAPLPVQYADYAVWQRRRLSGERLEARLAWWRERMTGAPALLEVPADHPRPRRPSQRGVTARLRLGPRAARALSAGAQRHGATPFMVLLAAVDALLYRYTGQDDLVVGSPAANRDRLEIERLIGFFVNTVLHRTDLSGRPSFAGLLERVRAGVVDASAHQDVPFDKLVGALQPARDPSHPPLFQVMLVSDRGWGRAELPGLALDPFVPDAGVAKFDLTFLVREGDGALDLGLEANLDLFEPATAARMLRHFGALLEGALAAPELGLADLPLLSAPERLQLLDEWNRTAPAAGRAGADPFLHHRVAGWAQASPDALAMVFGDGAGSADGRPVTWTYRALLARADRLARHLAALGVGPDVLVGLSAERSPELVLGVLAVLRAGGAWLPLDPLYPRARLQGMVDDAAPPVLLTQERLLGALPEHRARVVLLDRWLDAQAPADAASGAAPDPDLAPENLAYVIYTSGSTGRPKGVALSHRGLANLCVAQAASFGPGPGDRVVQFAPASFDASVFELAMALASGAAIHLAGPDALLPGEPLLALLEARRITNATMPPSALAALPTPERAGLDALSAVIVAGEACPPELARAWGGEGRRRFFNAYGPTETTVWATIEPCTDPQAEITIGRPVANARVHLLDRGGAAVPVGVPAELHVGGPGLARGYLHRPALTAERFVPDPFAARRGERGARLYRTGDLARYLPDGRIDFLGRIDHQVKVRGFRIELGEIEAVLTSHPEVSEAVALARESGPAGSLLSSLVAYVLARGATPEAALRRQLAARLAERLPAYMVPSALVVLDELPRTPAGKVDRKALPAPDLLPAGAQAEVEPPAGRCETLLAGIWAELLGLPAGDVSRHASFFDLGGHSLLATRVVARVREALGIELPVRRLFESPTLAALAAEIERLGAGGTDGVRGEGRPAAPPLVRAERPEGAAWEPPLSFAQERLWFLDQLQPGNATYNVPTAVRLRGRLARGAFRRALDAVVERHEALRTTFERRGGEPVQVIAPELRVPVPVADLARLAAGPSQEAEVRRLAAAEARTPFDLAAGPLVRATLVRLGPDEHALLLDMHHAVSDGWSVGVLLRELGALYGAYAEGREAGLSPLAIQYGDFALWQRGWLAGEVLEGQLAFWRDALAALPERLELPTDRPRPAVRGDLGGAVPVALGRELSEAVDRLARERGATPFMVLLAAFQALLGRWAGQGDLAVGSPVANRTHAATEDLIGFFVNTLVLRGDLTGDPAFAALLDRSRETALAAYAHQDLPFEKLVEELRPERSLAHTPLFQVMLVLQNAPMGSLALPGLDLEPLPEESPAAKFDLTLTLVDEVEGRSGSLDFRRDLFDRATAERMVGHLGTLLAGAVAHPEARLSELPWLTEAERRQLAAWNRTAVDRPRGLRIEAAVAARAAEAPERIAVVAEDRHLSYRALLAASDALAARLSALGVGPEVRVGVCAERSVELVAGLLAVLRAGGAYVPLDPSYPADRLAFMLADAEAPVVLAQRRALEGVSGLAGSSARVVLLDGVAGPAGAGDLPEAPPAPGLDAGPLDAGSLAYAIYTSGSTGRPKGAMNAHTGVVNRLLWMREAHGVGADDRFLQKTPFSFDVSVWELFEPLVTGARLVMARPEGHRDPAYLVDVIRREGITMVHFVPSMLQAFVTVPGLEACTSLRRVIASGEALPGDLRDRLRERLGPGAEVHNLYGPTETAIEVTAWPCADDEPGSGVPIGRPLANAAIHVVDPGLRPVAVGVPGELLIGGTPVGRGYLGRPALTAERFVPDPFAAGAGGGGGGAGARVYRTGDLARFRPDGAVEFLGRIDHQVKVRGFRIELGEIEAALEALPAVRAAVVVALPGRSGGAGDARLAAYLVPAGAEAPEASELRAALARGLPDYMVPAAFTVLGELPLTPSGKVDRRALPAPRWGAAEAEGRFVAPRTATEELVAELWSELLGTEVVGVEDDFFGLGGHSLLATRLMTRLSEAAGVELPLLRLFEAPTVAGLARAIDAAASGGDAAAPPPPLRKLPRDERGLPAAPVPLSPAQERLWFLDRLMPESPWYNVPAALRLRGELSLPALARSLAAIVARHEALRTVVGGTDEAPVQVVRPPSRARLPVVDLSAAGGPACRLDAARALAAAEARRPFDLARGPLFRATLLRLGAGDHVLLLTLHHIVSDGWSLGVFLRELSAFYGAGGGPAPVPELPVQYADFALWQRERLADGLQERLLGYWRERLAGAPPVLELPADRPRPPVQGLAGAQARLRLPSTVAEGLLRLGRRHGSTRFMTLLALFDAWLARHGAGTDLVVGSPVAGRDRIEVENLIGFFVNLLPLRVKLGEDPTVDELLAAARAAVLGAHAHREVPFEKLVEELRPTRDASHAPLVQAVLVLEDAPTTPELPGLAVESLEQGSGTAKFDLNLSLRRDGAGLAGILEYNRDLFDATTAARLAERFERLAAGVAAAANEDAGALSRLSQLPLLSPAERQQVALEWRETAARRPPETGLAELFAERARAHPDRVAVADAAGGEQVSYGELARRARRLAGRLAGLGVGPESRVGLALERSPLLVEAVLGILAAGGAYVPLDPGYPEERLRFMLADAGIEVLVTSEALRTELPVAELAARGAVVSLDGDDAARADPAGLPAPAPAGGDHLAYLMYTSGSTGRPKGVAVPQRAVVRLVHEASFAQMGPDETFLHLAPVSFDASTLELWGPLLGGGRMVVVSERTPSLAAIGDALARQRVTTLWLTAGLYHQMVEEHLDALAPVRQLLAGGDVLSPAHVRKTLERLPGTAVINGYGPTENTTFTCCHPMTAPADAGDPVPIGRPIAGTSVHLLGPDLEPVPVGVPGELLAGGAGLARGYHGRPGLTAERFVPDPFATRTEEAGGRLYRTGDRARFLPGGAIEFLGRLDRQVKVRGFRIELGEIEAALREHPEISGAAVVVHDGLPGGKTLVGYVAGPEVPEAREPADLRGFLRERLPEYMVPSFFVAVAELPLDPNGKVDRRALWAIGAERLSEAPSGSASVAPKTATERALAAIWEQVLGVAGIGAEDDFFELGGHSLLATRLVSRIRTVLGVDLPLRTLFERPTVAGVAAVVDRRGGDREEGVAPTPRVARPAEGADGLPLSFAQQRLWFLDRLGPGKALYDIPAGFRCRGPLRPDLLARALSRIVARHESLRTTFPNRDGEPFQRIAPPAPVPLPVIDLQGLAKPRRHEVGLGIARLEARRPFALERGPLLRGALVRLEPTEHLFLINQHHIVSDGWSVGLMVSELATAYGALLGGREPALPELPIQYGDYAVWQREHLAGGLEERLLGYWRERLAGAPPVLTLPTDRPRLPAQRLAGGRARLRLPAEVAEGLQRLGRDHGSTLFMTLLALFDAWLSRHGSGTDLVVGSPVAGRDRIEVENLIGFFVNLLPLRVKLGEDPTVDELLAAARAAVLGAHAHREVPFEKLVEELRPTRDASHAPLVQAVLVLEDAPTTPELPGLAVESLEQGSGTAKFDLNLSLRRDGAGLAGILEYNRDLFDATTAARLAERFERLAAGVAAAANEDAGALSRLSQLPLLSPAERQQVALEWRETAARRPPETGLAELFAERARAHPDRVAVADAAGGEQVSYGELARRARRLAGRLAGLGVGPESRVGLALERSPLLVEAVLGILAAGGAYVPLDPGYPEERLRFMLADAGIEVLVTSEALRTELPVAELAARGAVVSLDGDDAARADPAGLPAPAPAGGDHLAYLMYTSGSTGRPKGVAVPQRAVVRLVHEASFAQMGPDEAFLHLAPVSFDASTLELWGPLLGGGRMVVVSERTPSLAAIGDALARQRVTTLWLTAGLYHQMVEEHLDALAPVRQLLAGGDVLSPAHVRKTLERLPGMAVINGYGPTENTTFTCCHPMTAPADAGDPVPIGRPIAGTGVHLLGPDLEPVPVGVPGELLAGGAGLARGYHGRPGLTAERFVPDPFATRTEEAGGRLYRTGDRARFLPGGAIEFLGRLDRQVKVRGFRIELGEIEAALREHPEISGAAVVVHDGLPGGKTLVGYVAGPEVPEAREPADLRGFLRERLPEYMVPSFFVAVAELPLDPNGKVDRRALWAIGAERLSEAPSGSASVAPKTATEWALAAIWEQVLGVAGIGVEDDFFDLGGHSLLATRLISRVRAVLGVDLPLRTLFERPTVAAFARAVERAGGGPGGGAAASAAPIQRAPRPPGEAVELPLSFAQQRLWFLDRMDPGNALYDVPAAFRCVGALRPDLLARALSHVARRHESLRTTFPSRDGEPCQRIAPPAPVPLPVVDLQRLPEARRAAVGFRLQRAEAQRPFDLERGPLLRVSLVRLGPREHLLGVDQHHIVSDGWSVGVLAGELATAYGAYLDGREPELPELPIQYADFAVWGRRRLAGEVLERRLSFWRERLAGVPALELPTDRPRPRLQTFSGDVRRGVLPAPLARSLEEAGRGAGATLYMVLLAGFAALLGRASGQTDFAVGTPVAGRERGELEGLIGFFVNTLALRLDLGGDLTGAPSFSDLLARVRDVVLDGFAHQELPFDRVVEEVAPERDLARPPIFQVAFALQSSAPVPALAGLEVVPLAFDPRRARFDLGMTAAATGGGVEISIGYNTDLFDATRIERMLGHYRRLLEAAVAQPERALAALPLLAPGERHQVLAEWNHPARGLPLAWDAAPIATPEALVAARARRCPHAVAVVRRGEAWSYGALDRRVARLAATLRGAGVGPEVVVGVSVERSPAMVAALLAVLRAGGAYLPLDPAYPAERLAFMMADAGLSVLLTDRCAAALLPAPPDGVRRLVLEELDREGGSEAPDAGGLAHALADAGGPPEAAAYVIYTSGSTGEPKGVVGTRRAMGNLLADRLRSTVGGDDRVLQKTPVSFDASVFELFSPLVAGATLVLARPGGEQDAAYLVRLIAEERVTVAGSTPSMLATLLDQPGIERCRTLRRMATGSEAVPPELAERYHALGLSDLFNLYGPTETTVAVLEWPSRPGGAAPSLPIGRPIAGARAYLLDPGGEPVAVGVPGELVIGGAPLARGYLGRPAATAERYLPDPFAGASLAGGGGRMYRTGDLARLRSDGAVEFLGRIDRQVKIRGFRVELGEVERALLEMAGVREAAVVAQEVGAEATRRLVAFLVPAGEGARAGLDPRALRDHLAGRLPGFMVPSAFVLVDELPLTPSGKVDRKELAAREPGSEAALRTPAAEPVPPRDALESELAGIWGELLGLESVGVEDDFFELGGHSLLAVRLVARIAAATGREIPLASLFEATTVERLAALLRGSEPPSPAAESLVPLAPEGDEPPLLLVHAIGGSVFAYRELARRLSGRGQPVYALQSRGLAAGAEPHGSVEEMAAAYLDAAAGLRPEGPFRIAGWSFGALVAYEMARRLAAGGEEVELLLVDPTAPSGGPARGEPDEARSLELLARDLAALAGVELDLPAAAIAEAVRAAGPDGALDRVLEAASAAGALPPEVRSGDALRLAGVYRANARAAARYRPAPMDRGGATAVAIVAEESTAAAGLGRWRELLPGGLAVERVPGDHYSIFREPNVGALARAFERRLRCRRAVPADPLEVPAEE
jgi:amino acid adenylation domain-containing protein